jgi:prepilin-type N-terminal cleavage/methylation domain-containing protein
MNWRLLGRSQSTMHGKSRGGFTLVELIVVVAVIGVLMSLLLAAVQASRDAARRATCANNIKNHVLAIADYCAIQQRFPAGQQLANGTEYSWCVAVLPQLEQAALANSLDRTKPWTAPVNQAAAATNLRIFRCPGGVKKFDGKTDYGGLAGSMLGDGEALDNGILFSVGRGRGRGRPDSVRVGEVTDGLSNTIVVGECIDREEDGSGRWVSGLNCLSHDNGSINANRNDMFSNHLGGAYAGFADGRVQFLSTATEPRVIGAWCTRGGGETIGNF